VTEVGALYAEGRQRLTGLVGGLRPEAGATPVSTCPAWTVKDVLAHLTGVCADILAGNVAGVATDPWTAAQVAGRRKRTLDEIVEEWSDVAAQVEAFADNFPGRTGAQWVTDLTTHEHDIRCALRRPGARQSEGVQVGADFLVTAGFDAGLSARGLGPLEVRAGNRSWIAGGREVPSVDEGVFNALMSIDDPAPPPALPVGTLEASPFELMRALTGRRSRPQIARMTWTVDPEPYLPAFEFGPFHTSPTDIEE